MPETPIARPNAEELKKMTWKTEADLFIFLQEQGLDTAQLEAWSPKHFYANNRCIAIRNSNTDEQWILGNAGINAVIFGEYPSSRES